MNVDILLKTEWGNYMTRFSKVDKCKKEKVVINNQETNVLKLYFENGNIAIFYCNYDGSYTGKITNSHSFEW